MNFRFFTSALEDVPITLTSENKSDLTQLSDEFGYEDLREGLAQFQGPSQNWPVPAGDLQSIAATIPELRGSTLTIEHLLQIIVCQNRNDDFCAQPRPALAPPVSQLDSQIARELPTNILQEMQGREFRLLWRASRDGFNAREFHSRCNGHSNTLTLVMDVGGNIFGGFTPCAWEEGFRKDQKSNKYQTDMSRRSFVFTVKNPWGLAPMRFAAMGNGHICCREDLGPSFGNALFIYSNSDANTKSCGRLGSNYANYTGLDGMKVFTGDYHFQSREIEVFELTG
jgi:hypothetical protein